MFNNLKLNYHEFKSKSKKVKIQQRDNCKA